MKLTEAGACRDCGRNVYDESVKTDCRALGLHYTWVSEFQCWPCYQKQESSKTRLRASAKEKLKTILTDEEIEALFG